MKRGHTAQAKRALSGANSRRLGSEGTSERRDRHADADDLVRIVAVLAQDVETLDSMIRSHRPRLEEAGKAARVEREQALDQWTRIRARAVEVVARAHDTLEKVKQHPTAE